MLKHNIKKMKIMASDPITSWQIDGEKVKGATDFIFLGSKITVDGDCSHKIKTPFLGRKAMTNLDSVLQSRNITLPTKVRIVKTMVFPVPESFAVSQLLASGDQCIRASGTVLPMNIQG